MSDILIKNMEMPKSCGECRLAVNAYGSLTEGKCAVLGYGVTYLRERHDACPLVAVPPHGDLVEKTHITHCMVDILNNNSGEHFFALKVEDYNNLPVVLEATE